MPSYEILKSADWRTSDVENVARLHAELLPHSPVVQLGRLFMERCYYRALPRSGLMSGAIAYVDGQPAGFMAWTMHSAGFMGLAVRRHPLLVTGTLVASVLARPSRLKAIWEGLTINEDPSSIDTRRNAAELLSFGVLAPYRSRRFVSETGIRISRDLLEVATADLASRGARSVRAVVDEDNLEARLFYLGSGWQPGGPVAGWSKPVVEFLLDFGSEEPR